MSKLTGADLLDNLGEETDDSVETTESDDYRSHRQNDFDEFLKKVRKTKQLLKIAERGFLSELYEALADGYEFAHQLRVNNPLWAHFIKDPFWDECLRKKPALNDDFEAILRWVLRFLFNVKTTSGSRYNRVHKYARTLRRLADQRVSVEDVAQHLKEKGVEYAFSPKLEDDDDDDDDEKEDISVAVDTEQSKAEDQSTSSERADNKATITSKAAEHGQGSSTVTESSGPEDVPILVVEMTDSDLDRLLDAIKRGGNPKLTLGLIADESVGGSKKWIRVEAIEIEF